MFQWDLKTHLSTQNLTCATLHVRTAARIIEAMWSPCYWRKGQNTTFPSVLRRVFSPPQACRDLWEDHNLPFSPTLSQFVSLSSCKRACLWSFGFLPWESCNSPQTGPVVFLLYDDYETSAQLQWGALRTTRFTSWRVFPECKGDLRQNCCSLWEVKFKTSSGSNENAFAQKLVKEWTVTAFLSFPCRWQMSSPVGGYFHRKIVQQTSCQKLNRCLWISSIKFKSL